jgi:phospholipid-translocating ATPase
MNSKSHYHVAIVRVQGCNEAMATVVADTLEHDFELLGLTGIEDKL